jgi:hypothetical protein
MISVYPAPAKQNYVNENVNDKNLARSSQRTRSSFTPMSKNHEKLIDIGTAESSIPVTYISQARNEPKSCVSSVLIAQTHVRRLVRANDKAMGSGKCRGPGNKDGPAWEKGRHSSNNSH